MPDYQQTWNEYRDAIEELYRTPAGGVERGVAVITAGAETRAEDLVAKSEKFREEVAPSVETGDPDTRDVAGLKLIAAACYDLSAAQSLLEADGTAPAGPERAAPVVLVDDDLRRILDAPLDGSAMNDLPAERSALPPDPAAARDKLRETVTQFEQEVPKKAGSLASKSITGATSFAIGPVKIEWGGITDEFLAMAPQGVSWAVKQAARLAKEAVQKLWAAIGKEGQDQIRDDAKGWWEKFKGAEDLVAGLLSDFYDRDEIEAAVDASLVAAKRCTIADPFNNATRRLEQLLARYDTIHKVLAWALRILGWIKTPLHTLVPWGPIVVYGIYTGVLSYAVYSGGDYLDSKRFAGRWLDRVEGLRGVVLKELA